MKLTKCKNGHFYDEEKFETCPHCAGASKLNASSIFGQSSAPKAEAAKVESDDDVTVPLEWEPKAPAAEKSTFEPIPEEPETPAASVPAFEELPAEPEEEPAFTAAEPEAPATQAPAFEELPAEPEEEPAFTAAAPEVPAASVPAFEELPVEPEGEPAFTAAAPEVPATSVPAFEPAAEEPAFSSSAPAAPTAAAEPEFTKVTPTVEEPEFNISSQPSFDTPLDFDDGFTVPEPEEKAEEAKEEDEGFELLSKYSSDVPAEESTLSAEPADAMGSIAPTWEMPQPSVEEIRAGDQADTISAVDPELEDKPTEILDEAEADLVNGLLSEDEITGNVPETPAAAPEAPAFVPETPAFGSVSAAPEAPAFVPEAPAFGSVSAAPEAPAFVPETPAFGSVSAAPETPAFVPETPAFGSVSAAPETPAFMPEQPAAFGQVPADDDDDDDGHTVAFYDEIFTEVSKTAETKVSAPVAPYPVTPVENQVAEGSGFLPPEENLAPESSNSLLPEENQMPGAGLQAGVPEAPASEEPNVFTAPPLPRATSLPTPCVGWLIALNGAHIGQDFHLRVGKNYVGRDESMDVALTGDKSVSRHKHAIIIYEPKHHKYFIQPGESNELIYVNDEVVLLPMELKAYDLLVIGDIELWFMPLCDAEHNWSEVIRKLQEQMQQ